MSSPFDHLLDPPDVRGFFAGGSVVDFAAPRLGRTRSSSSTSSSTSCRSSLIGEEDLRPDERVFLDGDEGVDADGLTGLMDRLERRVGTDARVSEDRGRPFSFPFASAMDEGGSSTSSSGVSFLGAEATISRSDRGGLSLVGMSTRMVEPVEESSWGSGLVSSIGSG